MTTEDIVPKVRIKTDEQARKRKRKRPDTQRSSNKKKKVQELKGDHQEVKNKDKETEHAWSSVNIENETVLMSMGLASLEVLEDTNIARPGKRKRTKAPKSNLKNCENSVKTNNVFNNTEMGSDSSNKDTACTRTVVPDKKSRLEEKKEKLKMKRRERQAKLKIKRLENPDIEKEKLRKEKLKAKRKAKRAQKKHEKELLGLQSEFEKYIEDTNKDDCKGDVDKAYNESEYTSELQKKETGNTNKKEPTIESEENITDSTPIEERVLQNKAFDDSSCDPITASMEKLEEGQLSVDDDVSVQLSAEEKQNGINWLALDVCEPIVKALTELGFSKPTPIQEACIPAGLLKYKDVIGAAETGSGKTLAFGIPLIQRVMMTKEDGSVKGLVLCPTRELALQVTEHLVAASKYSGIRIVPIVGGIAAPKQERLLSYKPPILVATPGRLWQLIQEHEYLQNLTSIKFLVVDEADRMVEDGHFEEVTQIIGRLPKPEQRNTFLFSATLSFTIDRLEEKAKRKKKTKQEKRAEKRGTAGLELLVRNIGIREKVEKVDLTQKKGTAELLTETYFLCNVDEKDLHLYYLLLNHPGKILVFANAIDGVMNLVHILKLLGLPVFPLHSSLHQRQRFKFLDKFKKFDNAVLICTDIAARGLDIPEVDTVVHYQLPMTKEAYIHRSGRTARADNPGLSIAIVGPKDFKSYKKVASQMSEFPIDLTRLRVLRPAIQQARKIFKIERLQSRPEKKEAKLVALAKEAGLDDEESAETNSNAARKEVKAMKAELKLLLSQPVLDPLNSVRYGTRVGAMNELQTVSTFSLGVSALEHSAKKSKKGHPRD